MEWRVNVQLWGATPGLPMGRKAGHIYGFETNQDLDFKTLVASAGPVNLLVATVIVPIRISKRRIKA